MSEPLKNSQRVHKVSLGSSAGTPPANLKSVLTIEPHLLAWILEGARLRTVQLRNNARPTPQLTNYMRLRSRQWYGEGCGW